MIGMEEQVLKLPGGMLLPSSNPRLSLRTRPRAGWSDWMRSRVKCSLDQQTARIGTGTLNPRQGGGGYDAS